MYFFLKEYSTKAVRSQLFTGSAHTATVLDDPTRALVWGAVQRRQLWQVRKLRCKCLWLWGRASREAHSPGAGASPIASI